MISPQTKRNPKKAHHGRNKRDAKWYGRVRRLAMAAEIFGLWGVRESPVFMWVKTKPRDRVRGFANARATGIEPATTGSTIRYSNQLSYALG